MHYLTPVLKIRIIYTSFIVVSKYSWPTAVSKHL